MLHKIFPNRHCFSFRVNVISPPRKPSNALSCWVSCRFSHPLCAWWQQKQQSRTRLWGCVVSELNTPGSRRLWSGVPAFWPGCGPPVWCRAGPGESECPHFGKDQTGSQPGWLERCGSRRGSAGSTWTQCSGRRRGWPGWSTGWRRRRGHNTENEDVQTPPVTPNKKRAEREKVRGGKPWRGVEDLPVLQSLSAWCEWEHRSHGPNLEVKKRNDL